MLPLIIVCMTAEANSYYPDDNTISNVSSQISPSNNENNTVKALQATNNLMAMLDATTYKKFSNNHNTDNGAILVPQKQSGSDVSVC